MAKRTELLSETSCEDIQTQTQKLQLEERKAQLFAQNCKVFVSIALLFCCGLYVVFIPLLSQALRYYAISQGKVLPPHDWIDWLNEFTCAVGILSILAWGFNSVMPILQIMKAKTPPRNEDVIDLSIEEGE